MLLASCSGERISITEIGQRVESILELPTYEQVYRDIVYVDDQKTILFFIKPTPASVLFSIDIRIRAGIDLAEGYEVKRHNDDSVTVTLPEARILLIDADEETIREYFVREKGGNVTRLDYYDEIDRIKSTIAEDAIEREILVKARQNAESLVRSVLTAVGIREVQFGVP